MQLANKRFAGQQLRASRAGSAAPVSRCTVRVYAIKDGEKLDRKLRVAVVGGGPGGACAAEVLAAGGCETYLLERNLSNTKVCRVDGSTCSNALQRLVVRWME